METKRGLPNSCYVCGTPIPASKTWFARNIDEARSGKGFCPDCMVTGAADVDAPAVTTAPVKEWPTPPFLQEPEGDDLTDITGLGKVTAQKLNDAGITTFKELNEADPEALAEATGINTGKLQGFIDESVVIHDLQL